MLFSSLVDANPVSRVRVERAQTRPCCALPGTSAGAAASEGVKGAPDPASGATPVHPGGTGDTVTRQYSCGLSPDRHRALSPDREVVTSRSWSGLSPCHRF